MRTHAAAWPGQNWQAGATASSRPASLRHLASRLVVGIFAALAVSETARAAVALEDSVVRDRLVEQWAGQHSAIVSARLKYRLIQTSRVNDLTRPEVNQFLASLDLTTNPDSLIQLFDTLCVGPSDHPPVARWGEYEIVIQGDKLKETGKQALREGELVSQNVFDGKGQTVLRMSPSHKQANILPGRTGEASLTIFDLRFVPAADRAWLAGLQLASDPTGNLLLTTEGLRMSVEAGTGFVLAATWNNGRRMREIQQFGRIQGDYGVLFPRTLVRAEYVAERLSFIRVISIQDARFNEDLPENSFAVTAPAGTLVVDRTGDGQVRRDTLPTRVDDVAAYARRQRDEEASRGHAMTRRVESLVVAIVLSVCCVSFILWRRYRRTL